MERYTIVVTIMTRDSTAAFKFVEEAIAAKIKAEGIVDSGINVSSSSGIRSVTF